jgi:hypothetical protein
VDGALDSAGCAARQPAVQMRADVNDVGWRLRGFRNEIQGLARTERGSLGADEVGYAVGH